MDEHVRVIDAVDRLDVQLPVVDEDLAGRVIHGEVVEKTDRGFEGLCHDNDSMGGLADVAAANTT
jgi:hypothetical protein